MNKLNKIAGECGFTTKDEVVKLLFLIHNQDSRVQDELLKNFPGQQWEQEFFNLTGVTAVAHGC